MSRLRRTPVPLIVGLVLVGVGGGRLLPSLITRWGGTPPRVSWWAAVLLLFAAAAIGLQAWQVWKSLNRDRRTIASAYAVRLLALAKAGIVAGALMAGFYAGFAWAYLDSMDLDLGRERVIHGGAAAIASALLGVAGWFLERACIVPDDDDEAGEKTRNHPEPA